MVMFSDNSGCINHIGEFCILTSEIRIFLQLTKVTILGRRLEPSPIIRFVGSIFCLFSSASLVRAAPVVQFHQCPACQLACPSNVPLPVTAILVAPLAYINDE